MKKIIVLIISLFVLSPLSAFALIETTSNITYIHLDYLESRDQYALNYYLDDVANGMQYVFVASVNNQTYSKTWPAEAINKTIYINCNGVGDWYFKLNGVTVASMLNVVSTAIQNEICSVQVPGTTDYDLNMTGATGNGANGVGYGQYRIDYTKITGGSSYQLQRSTDGGENWTTVETDDGSNEYFTVNSPGLYRLNVTNGSAERIATDVIGANEFIVTTCNGCTFLSDILACPGWDDFLGQFTDAVAAAIPTPSDLGAEVGDAIVEKLAEQDVAPDAPVVPAPFDPGYPEQQTDLPAPVTTDINPPSTDFEPVTGGEGSGAFDLTDPLDWTPDDNDKTGGYVPPNPDSETPPAYTEPGGNEETPPAYNPPGGTGDTPPTYNIPGGNDEQPPAYEFPQDETPPAYNGGNNGQNEVPTYNYQ